MSLLRALVPSVALGLIVAPAVAQPVRPFSLAALKAAQARGEPILIDAFAPWCPTCRTQAPTIDALITDPAFAKLVVLRFDYDHQAAEKKLLGITHQSTLIAYKGSKETGRSAGITDSEQIRALAASTLR